MILAGLQIFLLICWMGMLVAGKAPNGDPGVAAKLPFAAVALVLSSPSFVAFYLAYSQRRVGLALGLAIAAHLLFMFGWPPTDWF